MLVAAGMRCGGMPSSVMVMTDTKKNATPAPCRIIGSMKSGSAACELSSARMYRPAARITNASDAPMRASARVTSRPARGENSSATSPDGRLHEPGPGRRVAELGLQPERQDHDVAEEHRVSDAGDQRADREVAPEEQAQVDDRVPLGELPDQERDEADGRHDRKHHDRAARRTSRRRVPCPA